MSKIDKILTFCRRNKDRGVYTGNVGGEVIRLVDREVYTPKKPAEIKFLLSDPEIEILCSDEEEQKEEDGRNEEKAKNAQNTGGKVLAGQVVARK